MASQLKVDTITGVTTAGSISVTGEGNSTTTNLQQGLAKVWCNFNGTSTVAIRASNNVSSITDNGTGDYTANFTNALADGNYAVTLGFTPYTTTNFTTYGAIYGDASTGATLKTTSAIRLVYKNVANDSNFYDTIEVNVVINGDLA
tara:strand:+ start:54 stop:491 length:438 start_codon:yes stop_codon:yes gene_type:complete